MVGQKVDMHSLSAHPIRRFSGLWLLWCLDSSITGISGFFYPGLWSASSATSLGILPQRSAVSTDRAAKIPLIGNEMRSFLRFRRRSPSSSSSNDSAVDLHPSATASLESDRSQYQNHAANNL